jgi:Zn-dependent protease with chaperone function
VKLNTANRAFIGLLVVSAAGYVLLGLAAVGLVSLIGMQAVQGRHDALYWIRGHDLRAALVFLVLVNAGTVFAVRSLRRQIRATRALAHRIRQIRVPTPPEVVVAARRTKLARRVDVVASDEPFSFAYGLVVPRVVVSEGLIRSVSASELGAVLEHERYHVRNLDPLKVVLARVLPWALFYVPALRDLRRRYVTGRELAADRRASEIVGRTALAGALYKVVQGPAWSELSVAAAIGSDELLDVRVTQLETGREPEIPGVSKLAALASTISIGGLVWAFAAALGEIGGPIGRVFGALIPNFTRGVGNLVNTALHIAFYVLAGRAIYRRLCRRHRPLAG